MNSVEKKNFEIQEKKRDPSIELLRIIGCFCVIGTHIKFDLKKKSIKNFQKIFNGCLCADGVAIFWYIMGFFLFNKIPYKKRINNLFKKICIPLILTNLFYFYFNTFHFNKFEIKSYFLKKTKKSYLKLFYRMLTFQGDHLWFCYVYILIVILFPSLDGLNNEFEKNKIGSLKIFLLFLSIFIENDILQNKVLRIKNYGFKGFLGAIPFIFCGNELKKNIDKFKNKKIFSISIFFFLGNNYIRSKIIKYTGKTLLIKWYTSFGILNCFFLFLFAYSIYDFLNNKIIFFIITIISNMTFNIYLIHMFVVNNIFKAYRIGKIYNKKGVFYYQIYSVFFVFSISFIFSIIIKICKSILFSFKKLFLKKIKIN